MVDFETGKIVMVDFELTLSDTTTSDWGVNPTRRAVATCRIGRPPFSVEKENPRRISALDDSETVEKSGAGRSPGMEPDEMGTGNENWHWDRIGKQVAAEQKRRRSSRSFVERKRATQNVKWWGGQMISGGATTSAGPD